MKKKKYIASDHILDQMRKSLLVKVEKSVIDVGYFKTIYENSDDYYPLGDETYSIKVGIKDDTVGPYNDWPREVRLTCNGSTLLASGKKSDIINYIISENFINDISRIRGELMIENILRDDEHDRFLDAEGWVEQRVPVESERKRNIKLLKNQVNSLAKRKLFTDNEDLKSELNRELLILKLQLQRLEREQAEEDEAKKLEDSKHIEEPPNYPSCYIPALPPEEDDPDITCYIIGPPEEDIITPVSTPNKKMDLLDG